MSKHKAKGQGSMRLTNEQKHQISMWWNLAARETMDISHGKHKGTKNTENIKNATGKRVEPGKQTDMQDKGGKE